MQNLTNQGFLGYLLISVFGIFWLVLCAPVTIYEYIFFLYNNIIIKQAN